jgi:hypothetical protein
VDGLLGDRPGHHHGHGVVHDHLLEECLLKLLTIERVERLSTGRTGAPEQRCGR